MIEGAVLIKVEGISVDKTVSSARKSLRTGISFVAFNALRPLDS
ncbi:MAG: hypothetical protein QOF80_90, partial [Verrucomicrobiota bacterium]